MVPAYASSGSERNSHACPRTISSAARTGSYMVILTVFLADNGKNLPLAGRLPTAAFWPLPAAIAAPLIAWSLRRHGGPEPAAGPAPAAGTADPPGLRNARKRQRAAAGRLKDRSSRSCVTWFTLPARALP